MLRRSKKGIKEEKGPWGRGQVMYGRGVCQGNLCVSYLCSWRDGGHICVDGKHSKKSSFGDVWSEIC